MLVGGGLVVESRFEVFQGERVVEDPDVALAELRRGTVSSAERARDRPERSRGSDHS
jgi:hypothetical protein